MLCTRFPPGSDAARVYAQIWVFRTAPESTFQTEAKAIIEIFVGLALHEALNHSADVDRLTRVQDVSQRTSMCSYGGYSTYSRSELRARPAEFATVGPFYFFLLVFACLFFAELRE